ncbi:MAG: 3-hexulose-6-phosphate synthase [Sedimenticola sp.]
MELQLALDMLDTDRALSLAHQTAPWIDIIEVGTPLLKHEGVMVVKKLASAFPGKTIVVDTKTMDVGAYEAEFCFDAGCHVMTVLGVADDATIAGAVECAQKYNGRVLVDLINVPDKIGRAQQVEQLGAHILGVHSGIDQQRRGHTPLDDLRSVRCVTNMAVAVAGGINIDSIDAIVAECPDVIIVGGAITGAEYSAAATKAIKERI